MSEDQQEEIKKEFKKDLVKLLKDYGASLEIDNLDPTAPEIIVYIAPRYDPHGQQLFAGHRGFSVNVSELG